MYTYLRRAKRHHRRKREDPMIRSFVLLVTMVTNIIIARATVMHCWIEGTKPTGIFFRGLLLISNIYTSTTDSGY